MTKIGGDILAVRTDIEAGLLGVNDELADIEHHWQLQEALRGSIDVPGALAELVRDYATRTGQPAGDVPMGKDQDGWEVHGSIVNYDGSRMLRLILHKNALLGMRWRGHNAALLMGVDGARAAAGEHDAGRIWHGRRQEMYMPYCTSPEFAEGLWQTSKSYEHDGLHRTIWSHAEQRERNLRGYLWMVLECGKAVLNATEPAYA